jgi:hypothetical protein
LASSRIEPTSASDSSERPSLRSPLRAEVPSVVGRIASQPLGAPGERRAGYSGEQAAVRGDERRIESFADRQVKAIVDRMIELPCDRYRSGSVGTGPSKRSKTRVMSTEI